MNNDAKSPATENAEPQISPQIGEMNAEQLDEVSGGNTASTSPHVASPPAPTP